MKKSIYTLLLFLTLCTQHLWAQDIIYKTSGEEIKAKVVEITLSKVLFKRPEQYADSIFSLNRQEVFMVKYANGQKELMNPGAAAQATEKTAEQYFAQGRQDARTYYRGNNALWGSAAATFAVGILGTAIIAAVPPKVNAREVPDATLLSNRSYYQGYRKQAHKRKVGKAALGGGIGILALLLVVSSLGSSN